MLVVTHSLPIAEEPSATRSPWDPEDLTDVLSGDYTPEESVVLRRVDGIALLYAGKTHSFSGESESGKSWLALLAAAESLGEGSRVLFLDYESDRATVAGRLLLLGVDRDALRARFDYVRPEGDPTASDFLRPAFDRLLGQRYGLVVIDGVTEALATFGYNGREEKEVAEFQSKVPDRFATRTGAAVVSIDHVVKSKDGRGRFALGSQHKLAGLTGAAYIVEAKTALRPGHVGIIDVRIAKDRPGWVRQHAGGYRASDRTQPVAVVQIDSRNSERTVYTVALPETVGEGGTVKPFRPTVLMERVSRALETDPGLTANKIKETVVGNASAILDALCFLIEDGHVRADKSTRYAHHHVVTPYRAPHLDAGEDLFVLHSSETGAAVPRPPSIDGGTTGTTGVHEPFPGPEERLRNGQERLASPLVSGGLTEERLEERPTLAEAVPAVPERGTTEERLSAPSLADLDLAPSTRVARWGADR
ncbi:hypothetical protein GCM10009616_11330 [Microlunatus lacustris]